MQFLAKLQPFCKVLKKGREVSAALIGGRTCKSVTRCAQKLLQLSEADSFVQPPPSPLVHFELSGTFWTFWPVWPLWTILSYSRLFWALFGYSGPFGVLWTIIISTIPIIITIIVILDIILVTIILMTSPLAHLQL